MHPIERLRYVARVGSIPDQYLLSEAMPALTAFARDPRELIVVLRQLIRRQPESAALVTLGARMVTALDPIEAGWELVDEVEADTTALAAGELATAEAGGVEVIDSIASGPDGFLCPPGSSAWVEDARTAGRTIVVACEVGTRLPKGLWSGWLDRNGEPGTVRPHHDLISHDLVEEIVDASGVQPVARWAADCPDVAELAAF